MTSSLRLRFFLITWPLVVAAVAGVALVFDRWTRVELDRIETVGMPAATSTTLARAASAVEGWARGDGVPSLRERLTALADSAETDLAVLDTAGVLVAVTDPRIRAGSPPAAVRAGEARSFVREVPGPGRNAQHTIEVTGRAVADATGAVVGHVFALPRLEPDLDGDVVSALHADARRTLWAAFLAASVVAAALSLLLAGPLVGQVGRLSSAAARLEAGDLAVRVEPRGADEVGRLERAFNAMAATVQRADAQKRNLVSDVAHELRTPVTNLLGLLEAVEDGLREADAATLDLLAGEARLLASLIEDLHELSLAESGQLEFERVPVDVAEAAAAAVDACRENAGQVILAAPDTDGPVLATADPRRFAQVLRNLLRNAITHTPAGGRVSVRAAERGSEVLVEVADTGVGIPADELPLVWERFHRVDRSRSRSQGGRGLGLAIVRQLVDGMGGRVSATSVEGVGSAFQVWLPAAGPPVNPAGSAQTRR